MSGELKKSFLIIFLNSYYKEHILEQVDSLTSGHYNDKC